MAIVIDGFLAANETAELLEQLPTPLLDEGQERRLLELDVPLCLERRMQRAVLGSEPKQEPFESADADVRVTLAARIATGGVPMHQDCFNPFDSAETNFIDDGVAVLYLSGAGSFVVDDGSGEQAIDIVPGRLVAWHNGMCKHRLDALPECGPRVMLGPVAIDAGGLLQRAHDVWSTHPGYIGYCESQAAEAEARGDHAEARAHLRHIGIPTVAANRLRELEARMAEKEERNNDQLCLTLTIEQDPESDGVVMVGEGMNGERIVTITIVDPGSTRCGTVLEELSGAVAKATSHGHPAFLLPDGTLLTEVHNEQTIEELFR